MRLIYYIQNAKCIYMLLTCNRIQTKTKGAVGVDDTQKKYLKLHSYQEQYTK